MPLRITRQPVIPAGGKELSTRQSELADQRNVKKGFQLATEDSIPIIYDGTGNKTWFVDTSATGNAAIQFPSADASVGLLLTVRRVSVGVNTCKLTALSGTLDGTATYSVDTLAPVRFKSDGTNYWTV